MIKIQFENPFLAILLNQASYVVAHRELFERESKSLPVSFCDEIEIEPTYNDMGRCSKCHKRDTQVYFFGPGFDHYIHMDCMDHMVIRIEERKNAHIG